MILTDAACRAQGLTFAKQSVAVTRKARGWTSKRNRRVGWPAFPCGTGSAAGPARPRAVGLLPAALQGIDIDALLAGAAACDVPPAAATTAQNPAALLALMWYHATGGAAPRTWWSCPTRTACSCSADTSSSW